MSHHARTLPAPDEGVIRRPETKSFILTSEFWVAAGAAAAVFIGGYALNDITNATAWKYGVWLAIAYIVSRGIAKAGSQRDFLPDPSTTSLLRDGHRDDRQENAAAMSLPASEPARQPMPREYNPADH